MRQYSRNRQAQRRYINMCIKASGIATDMYLLAKDAIPVIVAYCLHIACILPAKSLQTISLAIVGHLSPENLVTAAFAYMYATFNSEPVFKLLGQEPAFSRDTASFLTLFIPGGLGYVYFEVMKYLRAQGIMRPGTYILLIISPLNAGLNYLFCITLQLGLWGAPLATSLSYWLCSLSMVLYTNLGLFTRLAILGIIHVGAECIIMSVDQVLNTIPFGIGVAAFTRLGNLLGARDTRGVARTAQAAIWPSVVLGCAAMMILLAVNDYFARIFSNNPGVVGLMAQVIPYVALFQVADGLHGSCSGFLRATGKQHVGAAINIISYYCSALPFGIWLSRHRFGLVGLWIGQCAALYTTALAEWAIVCLSDWDKEVLRALERLDDGEGWVIHGSD
ncbi:uncharacterized protein ASPGLDRAFT_70493 [Aspergillus glaucus CBS 516.65]|uniref:Polysaccharide biosynthesis protein C-terminal domain-containing protein n=1 Tax=Aspergillus glaucus CBS 516.65 TaxID=1160497 RepID=A0A1L9V4R2_ASPGL|nr:hypothetical protein ASPGLDRAFT_70493 [Aspergillus glaucus CBS 516.65]OJJ78908.1 hypothetical protein ASPGLDRAFT_70493 [Aspergillus glaucus CBS 516.65]